MRQKKKKKRPPRFEREASAEKAAAAAQVSLLCAAADGNLSEMKFALMDLLQQDDSQDSDGDNAGGDCSTAGDLPLLQQQQQQGMATALYIAAEKGHLHCIRCLLQNGADPNTKLAPPPALLAAPAQGHQKTGGLQTPRQAATSANQAAAAHLLARAVLKPGVNVKVGGVVCGAV